jgi:23S rRNA (uracil1939-C5)-methyltransferase
MTEVTITRMGRRGEGVAHDGDREVFVPFVLPGETVEIDGTTLERVLTASPARRDAFCPHFGKCGGCLLQHWTEQAYRDWKRNLVVTALAQRNLDVPVAPLGDAHGSGRRRAVFHQRKGRTGFMALRSHVLVPIDHCPILDPALARAPAIAEALAQAAGDGDAAFTACDSGLDVAVKVKRSLGERLFETLAEIAGGFDLARIALNGETVIERRPPLLRIGTATVRLPVLAFLQATKVGEEMLAHLVMEALGNAKTVADLFCGIGPFALRLAERVRVLAVDSSSDAIAALNRAVREAQGLKPVETMVRDLFREPLTAKELSSFEVVVFDPPRAGAEAQARQLAQSGVPIVVAVSCDPQTFARDAAILVAGGYKLRAVTPVDQFKYSAHVEIVGVFAHSA